MADGTLTSRGTLLGDRYRVGPVLGHGGMSVVHRARDLVTGSDVAVKLFASGVTLDARVRQQREVALSRGLAHPAIAAVIDYSDSSDEAGPAYLVSELVDGPTLRARIADSPLTPRQVSVIGARLADALAHLHGHGIVHRDIKPANVLLPGADDAALAAAKLADFGVAIRLEDTRVTVDGFVVGTPTYLSPEQVTGGDITAASDVYSLGLVLIECLTQEPPFAGSGVECALARLHRGPAVPAGLPVGLGSLLQHMTAREAASRPSAVEVVGALRDGVAPAPVHTAVIGGLGDVLPADGPRAAGADDATAILPVVVAAAARRRTLIHRGAGAVVGVAATALVFAVIHDAGTSPSPQPSPTTNPVVAAQVPSTAPSTSSQIHVVATTSHPSSSASSVKKTAKTQAGPAAKPGPPGHGPGAGGPGDGPGKHNP